MRAKFGLEFYVGVPLMTADKMKIGALSIRGPARTQFSVVDMNILFEMAGWASGEMDTISQQRSLDFKHQLSDARLKINIMVESAKDTERDASLTTLQKGLGIVRDAVNATFVLLLKISPEASGLKSSLLTYSTSLISGTRYSLNPGTDMFQEPRCSL
jgi:hypothetical protein